ITEGGKQVLDIQARNEAIDLWNLQSYTILLYLVQGDKRASWCYFVDYILAKFLEMSYLNVRPGQILNVFLHNVDIPISNQTPLPTDIKRMILAACKYKLKFTGLSIGQNIKLKMPIWKNLAVNKQCYQQACHRDSAKCLRLNHQVRTV
ncbi:hypothetical protein B0H17DRAFT_889530, partial [Mycena rosella]